MEHACTQDASEEVARLQDTLAKSRAAAAGSLQQAAQARKAQAELQQRVQQLEQE
jgi:NAD-dependent DNA ligase